MSPADAFARLAAEEAALGASEGFRSMTRLFAEGGIWRSYSDLMALAARPVAGGIFVDIGCKYGHALPLALALGASEAIGIDVEPAYLEEGARIIGKVFAGARLAASDEGLLPLESESVEIVLVNEVISHVNPAYLDQLYGEIARILRPGGSVVISDGNNAANDECRADLRNVWDAWENGPAGRDTGRDVVNVPFLERRRRIVQARFPDLAAAELDRVAKGTFGLFGARLEAVLDAYARTGHLVERHWRPGLCPVNPAPGGVVMERAFHPIEVEHALAAHGLRARQVRPRLPTGGLRARASALKRRLRDTLRPEAWRGESWGFQVVGVREG